MGDSRKRVRNFTSGVKKEIGVSLFDVQMGTTPQMQSPLKVSVAGSLKSSHVTPPIPTELFMPCRLAAGFMFFMHFRRSQQRALKPQKEIKI